MQPFLSVIIPLYNEEASLRQDNLEKVYAYLKSQKFTWEMVLVNDGSSDGSLALLKSFSQKHAQVKVIDNPHQGKAATVAKGVFDSGGEYVLFSDTDQATPITEFAKFMPYLKAGCPIVIGSRSGRQGAPLYRRIMAMGLPFFRTLILQLPVKDSQCGFKVFKKTVADKIFGIIKNAHPPPKYQRAVY